MMNNKMKTMNKLAIIFLFLISCGSFSQGEEALKKSALKQAQEMVTAIKGGDVKTIVHYTHPKVISSLGGAEKTTAILDKTFEDTKKANATIDEVSIGKILDFKEEEGEYRCLIEKTTVTTLNSMKKRATQKSSLFGFYNKEKKQWTFVDGNRMKKGAVEYYFDDFKTSMVIPDMLNELEDLE